jgi:hypothetical protein
VLSPLAKEKATGNPFNSFYSLLFLFDASSLSFDSSGDKSVSSSLVLLQTTVCERNLEGVEF